MRDAEASAILQVSPRLSDRTEKHPSPAEHSGLACNMVFTNRDGRTQGHAHPGSCTRQGRACAAAASVNGAAPERAQPEPRCQRHHPCRHRQLLLPAQHRPRTFGLRTAGPLAVARAVVVGPPGGVCSAHCGRCPQTPLRQAVCPPRPAQAFHGLDERIHHHFGAHARGRPRGHRGALRRRVAPCHRSRHRRSLPLRCAGLLGLRRRRRCSSGAVARRPRLLPVRVAGPGRVCPHEPRQGGRPGGPCEPGAARRDRLAMRPRS